MPFGREQRAAGGQRRGDVLQRLPSVETAVAIERAQLAAASSSSRSSNRSTHPKTTSQLRSSTS